MAVNLLEKIDDEFLSCMICMERFKSPKTLSCLHTFCADCLQQHYKKNRIKPGVLQCPACRADSHLQQDGVHSLPANFFVAGLCEIFQAQETTRGGESVKVICSGCENDVIGTSSFCMNCKEFLCRICGTHHTRTKHTRDHQVVPGSEMECIEKMVEMRSRSAATCSMHENESIKLHCENCKVPVCVLCSVTTHRGHEFNDAESATETARTNITRLLSPAEQKVSKYQYSIDSAVAAEEMLTQSQHQAKQTIDETTDKMIAEMANLLRQHAENLRGEVDSLYSLKLKEIQKYKDKMEHDMEGARNACDYSRKVAKYGNVAEVLAANQQLTRKLESINTAYLEPFKSVERVEFAPKSRPSTRFQQVDVGSVGLVSANLVNPIPTGQGVQCPQIPIKTAARTNQQNTAAPSRRSGVRRVVPAAAKPEVQQRQPPQANLKQGASVPNTPVVPVQLRVYDRVRRGPDWTWGAQDGGVGSVGRVMSQVDAGGWVKVKWDCGLEGNYRMGNSNKYDLQLA
ncbi:E3 ubiquitin-protein ligase TRIM56-like [Glandiceps talaboti]